MQRIDRENLLGINETTSFSGSRAGRALIQAIQAIPGGEELDADKLDASCNLLILSCIQGRQIERPQNSNSSRKVAIRDVERLHEMSDRMIKHISLMKKNSIEAFGKGEIDLFDLQDMLVEVMGATYFAISQIDDYRPNSGAPPVRLRLLK